MTTTPAPSAVECFTFHTEAAREHLELELDERAAIDDDIEHAIIATRSGAAR